MAELPLSDPDRSCRSCGAAVVWAVNPNTGKYVPFNAEPDAAKGMHAIVDGKAVHKSKLVEPAALHVSHFATCPQANGWRNR